MGNESAKGLWHQVPELPPCFAIPSETGRGQDRHATFSSAQVWGGEALLGVGRSARPRGNQPAVHSGGRDRSAPLFKRPGWGHEMARSDDLTGHPWGGGRHPPFLGITPTRVSSPAVPLCLWYSSLSLPVEGAPASRGVCLGMTPNPGMVRARKKSHLCAQGRGQAVRMRRSHSCDQGLPSILCAGDRDRKMGKQHPAETASWPRPPETPGPRAQDKQRLEGLEGQEQSARTPRGGENAGPAEVLTKEVTCS